MSSCRIAGLSLHDEDVFSSARVIVLDAQHDAIDAFKAVLPGRRFEFLYFATDHVVGAATRVFHPLRHPSTMWAC